MVKSYLVPEPSILSHILLISYIQFSWFLLVTNFCLVNTFDSQSCTTCADMNLLLV